MCVTDVTIFRKDWLFRINEDILEITRKLQQFTFHKKYKLNIKDIESSKQCLACKW